MRRLSTLHDSATVYGVNLGDISSLHPPLSTIHTFSVFIGWLGGWKEGGRHWGKRDFNLVHNSFQHQHNHAATSKHRFPACCSFSEAEPATMFYLFKFLSHGHHKQIDRKRKRERERESEWLSWNLCNVIIQRQNSIRGISPCKASINTAEHWAKRQSCSTHAQCETDLSSAN